MDYSLKLLDKQAPAEYFSETESQEDGMSNSSEHSNGTTYFEKHDPYLALQSWMSEIQLSRQIGTSVFAVLGRLLQTDEVVALLCPVKRVRCRKCYRGVEMGDLKVECIAPWHEYLAGRSNGNVDSNRKVGTVHQVWFCDRLLSFERKCRKATRLILYSPVLPETGSPLRIPASPREQFLIAWSNVGIATDIFSMWNNSTYI